MELEFEVSDTDTLDALTLYTTEPDNPGEQRVPKVCLDKWLWAARFFITRAVARAALENGEVFYNGHRANPNQAVAVGAILTIQSGRFEKTVILKGLSTRRHNPKKSAQLFEEITPTQHNAIPAPRTAHTGHNPRCTNPGAGQPKKRSVFRFLPRSFTCDSPDRGTPSIFP